MERNGINVIVSYQGLLGFTAKASNTIKEHASGLDVHLYHAECNTRKGVKDYCPKCDRVITKDEQYRGYEVAGQIAKLTKEDTDDLKVASGITVLGYVPKQEIELRRVKAVYSLKPSTDKKTMARDEQLYEIFRNTLKTFGGWFSGSSKLRNAGYKSGGDEMIIRYNQQYDTLELIHLYYPDELTPITAVPTAKGISEEQLKQASELITKSIKPFDLDTHTDQHLEKLMEKVMARVEEQITGQKPEEAVKDKPSNTADQLIEALKVLS